MSGKDLLYEHEEFIREKIEKERWTHKRLSLHLQYKFPGKRGLTVASLDRFCRERNIHKTSRLTSTELDEVVTTTVSEVGAVYGRRTLTGVLASKGIKVGERRVGDSLRIVSPEYSQARRGSVARLTNPGIYRADYFGQKLHIDQNEKNVMFGITHVCAVDGFSRKTVAFSTMPIKNNYIVYETVYRQTICQYGMWDQLRVDQGKEWYLMLYMQEYLTEHRRNPHASPYLQTTSTQVDPASVYLKDSVDQTMYFPRDNGTFNLIEEQVLPFSTLVVEGRNVGHGNRQLQNTGTSAPSGLNVAAGTSQSTSYHYTPASTPSHSTNLFSTNRPLARRVSAPASFTLKLVQAKMTRRGRKVKFQDMAQTFIELVDSTAKPDFIRSIARQIWTEDFLLVTPDGLKVENCPGTQGLPFWRAPKRKVYAVKEEDFQSLANTDSDSDGDERDVAPRAPAKRMKLFQNEFKTKMSEMKRDIKQLIENTVPSPVRDELRGLLRCCICQAVPIQPPVFMSTCCHSIIGCQPCVQQLTSTQGASCPLCRDRDFEAIRLNGMDGLISAARRYIPIDNQSSSSEN